MILLVLAVLWIAVLTPSIWKKRTERRGTGSIDSFHHQLHLLEQTGPKMVAPAYKLETAAAVHGGALVAPSSGSGLPTVTSMPGRPKLVLLPKGGSSGPEGSERIEAEQGLYSATGLAGEPAAPGIAERPTSGRAAGPLDEGSLGRPEGSPHRSASAAGPVGRPARGAQTERRRQAVKRRRDIFVALVGTFVLTLLLGAVPALRTLWIITVLSGVALAAYVGLMAYARRLTLERRAQARSAGRVPYRERATSDHRPAPESQEALWLAEISRSRNGVWSPEDEMAYRQAEFPGVAAMTPFRSARDLPQPRWPAPADRCAATGQDVSQVDGGRFEDTDQIEPYRGGRVPAMAAR